MLAFPQKVSLPHIWLGVMPRRRLPPGHPHDLLVKLPAWHQEHFLFSLPAEAAQLDAKGLGKRTLAISRTFLVSTVGPSSAFTLDLSFSPYCSTSW